MSLGCGFFLLREELIQLISRGTESHESVQMVEMLGNQGSGRRKCSRNWKVLGKWQPSPFSVTASLGPVTHSCRFSLTGHSLLIGSSPELDKGHEGRTVYINSITACTHSGNTTTSQQSLNPSSVARFHTSCFAFPTPPPQQLYSIVTLSSHSL